MILPRRYSFMVENSTFFNIIEALTNMSEVPLLLPFHRLCPLCRLFPRHPDAPDHLLPRLYAVRATILLLTVPLLTAVPWSFLSSKSANLAVLNASNVNGTNARSEDASNR
jgi:hypothetical protein